MQADTMAAVFARPGEREQRALIARLTVRHADAVASLCAPGSPPSVRRWAVEALAAVAPRRALAPLRQALRDPAQSVRLHALRALAGLRPPGFATMLRPLLADESGALRLAAVELIGELRPRGWRDLLDPATRDEKAYVRTTACRVLES